jgi:hypothetical protein
MAESIANLMSELKADTWRSEVGFSSDLESYQTKILQSANDKAAVQEQLAEWLQRFQPCLFGRIAAKLSLLTYCILTDEDLLGSDEAIATKIQDSRTEWTREAFEGKKSGFIILAVSGAIARAEPNSSMKALAQRLCSLYLMGEVLSDQIYLDEVFLEKPGPKRMTWRWNVGINYFCSNGDKRWWADHRIPGGLAFSMNSVGHMVKSTLISQKLSELNFLFDTQHEELVTTKIDSLEKALEFAMRTIHLAAETISGKATLLLPLPPDPKTLPVRPCPVKLPAFLSDRDYCQYAGYYHTDYTIPSEYFVPAIERRANQTRYELDFTYLFQKGINNPAFTTTGKGRRIRAGMRLGQTRTKSLKSEGKLVPISSSQRLSRALRDENGPGEP